MIRSLRPRDEQSGAVAIMVALMAVVLMLVAAMSVDLGNAWARGRSVQKQADLAAIGAGSLLPMSPTSTGHTPADIAARAADLLNTNAAQGQVATTATDLLDADVSNGSLAFFDKDGSTCVDKCPRMRLTPPASWVEFGLAGMVSDGVSVVRSATVEVYSELPPMDKVVPLWLPYGCGYGPVDADTDQGGPTPTVTLSPDPASSDTTEPTTEAATPIPITPLGTHTLTGTDPITVVAGGSVTISNYTIGDLDSNTAKASIRMVSPDGTRYIEYAASSSVPHGQLTVQTFTVSTEVTDTPGTWSVYAMAQASGSGKAAEYSSNSLQLTVTGTPPTTAAPDPTDSPSASASPTSVPVGCVGQDRGNFGQMASPRKDSVNQEALAMNMAVGLDHLVVPFDTQAHTPQKECADKNGNNVIAGAQLDDASVDGNNCIIADSGNDGPAFFQGLVTGINGHPGRIAAVNGTTRSTGCGQADTIVGGVTINNDVLSSYLKSGYTLGDISGTAASPEMLDQEILNSPRFVWLPMVLANDRAQQGYQPIIDYVAGFITDEVNGCDETASNGVTTSGNSLKSIRLFAFNKNALNVSDRSPNHHYNPTIGRALVRLIG